MALHAGIRATRPRTLRHQSAGAEPGRGLDRRLQPRPQALRLRQAQPGRLRARPARRRATRPDGCGMTSVCTAPDTNSMVPSSPASRPRPAGGLRPALTPPPGGTTQHRSGPGSKDQQSKIRLTEVSTVWGDCRMRSARAYGRSPSDGAIEGVTVTFRTVLTC